MIASWDPGTEYYPGSGQTAGGPRIAFLMLRPYQFFPTLTDDGKKMLENAVLLLLGILGGEPTATEPSPADAETDVPCDVILAWTPGESINTHDVYFGRQEFHRCQRCRQRQHFGRTAQSKSGHPHV